MTTTVQITAHGNTRYVATLYPEHAAAKAVRTSFNPSGKQEVEDLKTLAAAFIAKCQELQHIAQHTSDMQADVKAEIGRAAALAITNAQQASMWAVFAATAS